MVRFKLTASSISRLTQIFEHRAINPPPLAQIEDTQCCLDAAGVLSNVVLQDFLNLVNTDLYRGCFRFKCHLVDHS